jgi:uncharacterized protein YegL
MSSINIPDTILDRALEENNNQRCPCVLVLDGSGSMGGPPVDQLNAGLQLLEQELKKDSTASQRVQLMVIRLGDNNMISILRDWTDAMEFTAPHVIANGVTPLGEAVRFAIEKLEEQKERYRKHAIKYYRPWLFIMTDGVPTDQDWQSAASACRAGEVENKWIVWAVGVGDQADLNVLSQFSSAPPAKLDGLKFQELFRWLSNSLRDTSHRELDARLQIAAPNDWMARG